MTDSNELLSDLTDAQRAAATHVDGPLLIVAGPGSGKTRVITRRVAYLIAQGIPGTSILSITFTNKAAGEMKNRICSLSSRPLRDWGRLDQPWPIICTFHSLCLRILRHYAVRIGLPANFSIYDSADQTRAVKEAIKTLEISSTNFSPGTVHGTISNAKNQLITAQQFAANASDFYARTVARIFTKYQQILDANNALDFDDLLLRATRAFRDHPNVLAELQERFQYILIDEYQDTNHAQYILAHALAMKHRNICVVGDPDQSVYAWRGADIKNILEFEKDYPDANVVKLEQNYRSTKTILRVADDLIRRNTQRKEKSLFTENDEGERVKLVLSQDEYDEADVVMRELRELSEKHGFSWSDMAIFYRINALSRVMEDALRRANIPYQIARGVEFYNRKEIKDVLAYLRVIANAEDELSLTRIVNVPPRGIGDASMTTVHAWGVGHGLKLWDAMKRVAEVAGLNTRAINAIQKFVAIVEGWRKQIEGAGGVQAIMESVVTKSGIEAALKKAHGEETGEDHLANVNELISSAAEYDAQNPEGSLVDYLAGISLVSDVDHMKGTGGAVTLMTLHAAKGLEFPVVAMIGLEEGCLPHARARGNQAELEEERRLCFVGITRAEKRLLLTKAAYRTMRGLRERTVTSPFLNEMPRDAMELTDRTGLEYEPRDEQVDRTSTGSSFRRGQMVKHPTFGVGKIVELSDAGRNTRAIVEFSRLGARF